MCLYPRLIKNPKYISNQKNGGLIPTIYDTRVLYLTIGCDKCIECRNKEKRKWQLRLTEDIKEFTNGKFITLTFNDQSILKLCKYIKETNRGEQLKGYYLDNQIATVAIRLFLERWRKKFKKSLRHWLVTELGHYGTENIHLHGIIFTDELVLTKTILEDIWQYGHVWKGKLKYGKLINYVNNKTINYIIKYVHKQDEQHPNYKPKILSTPGIGRNYINNSNSKINKYNGENTQTYYKTESGHKIALPIYWRNKLYTEVEREQLWLYQLDKQVRYVCGEKIDISQDYNSYLKTVEWYRKKNARLGYGTDFVNYEQREYENICREIMRETRIKRHLQNKAKLNGLRHASLPAG